MSVIELRQYTLHAGRRDELIELFEREFVESQEACGIELVGTFRDVSDPERFVWLRRFPDMVARAASLEAFYDGAVWREHRTAANATMVDSDDVLLLRPVSDRFDVARKRRTASAEAGPRGSALVLSIADVSGWDEDAVTAAFESDVAPALVAAGFSLVAGWVTAHEPNTFPRLPIREDADVLVWLSAGAGEMQDVPITGLPRPVETRRLFPTARSLLFADPARSG
ncbi:MAG TPA: NIPSNAP family protein [Candidatus Dormibacteraeota bacterium]